MTEHWSERPEGGGRFALKLIRNIGLRCGRNVSRILLYPITLYFFLRRGPERRSSYDYLQRVLGQRPSAWQVLRHFHYFATTIMDRVFLLTAAITRFKVRMFGVENLHAHMRPDRGVMLVGAHVGSFEVLRALALTRPETKVRVVLDTQKTPAMTELLHALNPDVAATVIDAGRPGHEVVLAMHDAMQEGALATLLGDRARPGEATVVVDFLGAPAHFPVAPFLIGSVLKVPIVLCLGMYRGGNRYDLYFETLHEQLQLPRRGRDDELRAAVQHYATRLEHYLRIDPYNWFNWYDFWNPETSHSAEPVAADVAMSRRAA